jgi:hypothetical protein
MVKFTIGPELADAVTRIEFAQFFTRRKEKKRTVLSVSPEN